jgi:hypothetical protein
MRPTQPRFRPTALSIVSLGPGGGGAAGLTASVINEGSEGKGSSERLFGNW